MSFLSEIFQYEWVWRALFASVMVGVMCGILGCFIVLRNMALIGDALSHAILPGVVFAFMIAGYSTIAFFVGSVVAGLIAAVSITWIQHHSGTKNDAAVGIIFTSMFAVGVMGISWISRTQGVHLDLKDFLFGNVLGVSDDDLLMAASVLIYVLLSIIVFYRYLFITTFQPIIAQAMGFSVKTLHYFLMLLLSVAVVASLQTVGVILVVAMLITPASTALLLTNRLNRVLLLSALIGGLAAIVGFFGALWIETVPGPAMTVAATLFYFVALLFAPQKGLVTSFWRKRKLLQKIRLEDVLKQTLKLHERGILNRKNLEEKLGFSPEQLSRYLQLLRSQSQLTSSGELTQQGEQTAQSLVRAHRLWETYLAQQVGLDETQIHNDAERYEHLLTIELLEEVDRTLGFPTSDPHGSPIPMK